VGRAESADTDRRKLPVFLLLGASLLWAFSFGLIKAHLTTIDPWFVTFARLALAALAFLPWTWRRRPPRAVIGPAMALGAIQFGLMYVLYTTSFAFLPAYGVALWTVFTPFYVLLIDAVWTRRLGVRAVIAVVLAVGGAAIVFAVRSGAGSVPGILLVQGANLCFAAGQLGYCRLVPRVTSQAGLLGWMYLGAAVLAAGGWCVPGQHGGVKPDREAWLVLLYLGLVPTAGGFALWNRGAVGTNSGILAVVNNLKVPLAVLVSWLVFAERADHLRVVAGLGLVVFALFVADKRRDKE
jgi:drug/metabolite transporter (DMT)-like permease